MDLGSEVSTLTESCVKEKLSKRDTDIVDTTGWIHSQAANSLISLTIYRNQEVHHFIQKEILSVNILIGPFMTGYIGYTLTREKEEMTIPSSRTCLYIQFHTTFFNRSHHST